MQQPIASSGKGQSANGGRANRPGDPWTAVPSETLLSSLAILRINWDERGQSYVDNFLPFVADCMLAIGGREFTAEQLRESVVERFKIQVPASVIGMVLKKAARQGLGRRARNAFWAEPEKLERYNLRATREKVLREQRTLVHKLRAFARDEHGLSLSAEDAERGLLGHIDEHAVSLLEAVHGEQPYQPGPGLEHSTDYVVSQFILTLFERDPEGFAYLETIVQGSMLASALYLPQVAEAGRRFTYTVLYFDTPVLLRALGYEGRQAQDSVVEMMDSAYALGASLVCFENTLVEIRGVLHGAAASIRRPRSTSASRRPVEQYFIDNGLSPSDIQLRIERLEDELTALRIRVKERPDPVTRLTVDEQELERNIRNEAVYTQDNAVKHDLDALTAIYRLRTGEPQLHLETCRALFVTTNAPLVRVAARFFGFDTRSTWPLAMLQHDVGTLIWLKRPAQAPELPRKQLIADCYAALQPPPGVWGKYLAEIVELRDQGTLNESDYAVLRYSNVASQALMDQTRGDAKKVTRATIDKVLEKASAKIQHPLAERVRELEAGEGVRTAEQQAAVDRAERAEAALRATEEARRQSQKQLAALRSSVERSARRTGTRVGQGLRIGATGAVLLIYLAAIWLALPSQVGITPKLGNTWPWVARVAVAGGAVLGALALFFGGSILGWGRALEVAVSRRVETRLLRKHAVGPPVVDVSEAGQS